MSIIQSNAITNCSSNLFVWRCWYTSPFGLY